MNLQKLFEAQAELDKHIYEQHPVEDGEDRLAKKILALQVELGECANEWRGFKYWSDDQEPRINVPYHTLSANIYTGEKFPDVEYKNLLLEEYVDCLHFILSIGLELNITPVACDLYVKAGDISTQFLILFYNVSYLQINRDVPSYHGVLKIFVGLGEMLGFSWEQIEKAYFEKNAVNHRRQETGY